MKLDELIKSLKVFSDDTVVICEAEPFDQPGPKMIYVNERFTEQTGYTYDEAIGKTPRILQGEGSDKAVLRRIAEKLRRWEHVREEVLNYKKDGTPFWTDLSIVPVADETGWYLYWVSIQRDVTEIRKSRHLIQNQKTLIEHAATHDTLTGLLNRAGFRDAIDRQISSKASRFGVLCLDLDRFKTINDTLGHSAGDAVLKELGARLQAQTSDDDCIARLGGDEFLLMRPNTSHQEIQQLATNLQTTLAKPVQYGEFTCRFGVSVGVAIGSQEELFSDSLLNKADFALRASKRGGRSKVTVFDQKMETLKAHREAIYKDLPRALKDREFVIYVMPEVNASDLSIVGYEALVRWDHPRLGLLMPHEFLPIADGLDMTREIDRIVLQRALDFQQELSECCDLKFPISVNVSSGRLHSAGLLDELLLLDIAPGMVNFELLETILLDTPTEAALETIERIKVLNIGIEVDDFGSGHASIVSLLSIKPHRVKIDRAIIEPINQAPRYRQIVSSIIDIARALELQVIAEGVETELQSQTLRELGCDFMQGYFFGEPRPAQDIIAMHCQTTRPGR